MPRASAAPGEYAITRIRIWSGLSYRRRLAVLTAASSRLVRARSDAKSPINRPVCDNPLPSTLQRAARAVGCFRIRRCCSNGAGLSRRRPAPLFARTAVLTTACRWAAAAAVARIPVSGGPLYSSSSYACSRKLVLAYASQAEIIASPRVYPLRRSFGAAHLGPRPPTYARALACAGSCLHAVGFRRGVLACSNAGLSRRVEWAPLIRSHAELGYRLTPCAAPTAHAPRLSTSHPNTLSPCVGRDCWCY